MHNREYDRLPGDDYCGNSVVSAALVGRFGVRRRCGVFVCINFAREQNIMLSKTFLINSDKIPYFSRRFARKL